jgi:aminocarboxymuconate-semialdehyde decarboxylase
MAQSGRGEASYRRAGTHRFAIDFHAHLLVPDVFAVTGPHSLITRLPSDPPISEELKQKSRERGETVNREMADVADRVSKMDELGVDVQVLTSSLVHQRNDWADPETSLALDRKVNDRIAAAVRGNPDRFCGLGSVPLHAPALAVAELERCVGVLGLKGVQISTSVGEKEIGDPTLRPFWAKAAELNAIVYIHPAGNPHPRFQRYYLWNSIGQSFEEAMAIASLMYDGVLEAFPDLKICIAHGGGYMPYYTGRIDRNYFEKAPTRRNMSKPPVDYLRRLYYDSCVYVPSVLENLVEKVGADRVVLGSDYPVGGVSAVDFVCGVEGLSAADKEKILWQNAAAMLGTDVPQVRAAE